MHKRLKTTDFWSKHVASLLAEVSRRPAPNRPFSLVGSRESPVRRYKRERFRESITNMLAGAYTGKDDA